MFFLPVIFLLIYRLNFIHPVSTLMIRDWMQAEDYKREWVELSDIAFSIPAGVVMSEDGQFCRHAGVDWMTLLTIVKENKEPLRGGSTITMQMVKNLFLWPSRSYVRKVFEIVYSLFADFILPKRRIMEIYLNIAEWGPGIYGIEEAALYYFNQSAQTLTVKQAAALVASLPNPYVRNPHQPTERFLALTQLIQKRITISNVYTTCLR
ncbi:biosynthetic peptidoglycan transglycosylase [Bartonella sp. F02]|uniref:biosynthetic peptidoglycan transglycosylase n=1 Tax=Bartonella sp. F02 TaxID=2967262 RepID=UPI0022A92B41|nr:transglycosylase domain-containing protein [Bartonella sp. F02]